MGKWYINDCDRVVSPAVLSMKDLEYGLPRPYSIWHDDLMRRIIVECPTEPNNHPANNLFWKELVNVTR